MQTLPPPAVFATPETSSVISNDRPSLTQRRLTRSVDLLVVLGVTAFVIAQLRPGLLFGPNLDDGGDNAAHVVAVSYFVHSLLSHGALSGWDPQWFDGFPLYVFYFPLPALLVAGLNVVVPYAVAFKLVTVLGTVTLPVAAYAFGRLAGCKAPLPALLAVSSLAFLFNPSYTIDGGNLASTLAGEFSFSLAISIGLVFLGVFVRSLRTGKLRALAAALFALTVITHVVPALYFAGAAVLIAVCDRGRKRSLITSVQVLAVGGLLAGFWLIRFAADLGYASSMNYVRVSGIGGNFFPATAEVAVQCLAALGALAAIARRDRLMIAMTVLAGASFVAFNYLPSGLIYNARWLPFWFLTTTILAAYALYELGRLLFFGENGVVNAIFTPIAVGTLTIGIVGAYLGVLPGYTTPSSWRSFLPGWVQWNYSGYQARSGWQQFSDLITMLNSAGEKYGCGRLDYEYTANIQNVFGSTLAEMSFPYFTNNCIDTTEGVYYESSTTNDFHFLDQSELSISSSQPVTGIPYESLDVADGIRHLQLAGVKYFLANSLEVERQAAADPLLTEVDSIAATPNVVEGTNSPASSLRWVLYEIKDSTLVSPLTKVPLVEAGQSKARWLATGISWYQTPSSWPVEIVRSGESNWPTAPAGTLPAPALAASLAPTAVTKINMTNQQISFSVSRVGVPVVVKVPFFPNWQATGAKGPYEASPNMMVVVPTSHRVVLNYATTSSDWLARGGSVVGLFGVAWLGLSKSEPERIDPLEEPDGDLTAVGQMGLTLNETDAGEQDDAECESDGSSSANDNKASAFNWNEDRT